MDECANECVTIKTIASIVGMKEERIFRHVVEILESLGDDYFTNEQLLNMLRNTRSKYIADYAMRMLMKRGITPVKKQKH
jgi:hypothetical protein